MDPNHERYTLARKENYKLHSFHMGSLRHLIDISWRDRIPKQQVLERVDKCVP
jgi:hypothetical protein